MYVRAVVNAKLGAGGKVMAEGENHKMAPLVIPDTAPLITGKRSVVYVAIAGEEGVYEGREILLGPRAKNTYVVVDGLKEGDQVVVNGNFKIDSQVQVMAKSSMMTIEGGHPADAHHHHGGSEVMETNGQPPMPSMGSSPKMDINTPMKSHSAPTGMRGKQKHSGQ
jgi:Cu(I)/Ag(I) efflux system membrane fusion protein